MSHQLPVPIVNFVSRIQLHPIHQDGNPHLRISPHCSQQKMDRSAIWDWELGACTLFYGPLDEY